MAKATKPSLKRRQLSPTKQTHCAKVPLIEQSILHKIYIRSNPECKHLTVALVAQQLKICTCGL